MAHKIYFTIPERELGKGDIVITIYEDYRARRSKPQEERVKEKLGELRLSKGGVDWNPKDAKKKISRSWAQIARLIESKA